MKGKRIVVSVISDLVSDQRVHKVCTYLHQKGYVVMLIGRRFTTSAPLEKRIYKTERISCSFKKGMAQYAEFNFKLFLTLLRKRTDVFLANDLDTLVPNYLNSILRKKALVYDSHEYFIGTPELQEKPLKRKLWKTIESLLLPKIKRAYTVNQSIAELYKNECGINMKVVRNVPICQHPVVIPDLHPFPLGKFVLLLQGAGINKERGAEELVKSMQLIPDQFLLVFIGSGDAWQDLQAMTKTLGLTHKIQFIRKVPFDKLSDYTRAAHLGISLDKPTCINYALSLPNKLFDYIHSGLPVLASNVVEVKRIVDTYNIGMCISEVSPKAIAEAILWIYNNKALYDTWKQNTIAAAREFCWEKEQLVLDKIFTD